MRRRLSIVFFAAFAIACGALLTSSRGADESLKPEKKTEVVKWEYRREKLTVNELAKAGEEGWEAFAISPYISNGYTRESSKDVVYLKRQKN
jgi:hypothetical protein